ncbi:hypothetical protein E3N88_09192 [Mikania micrantha]|uniref:Uncharacterized protein n=1 Tax=Mikania micrantha TaxID=192012 RepID=A0A5N6PKK6_9ASTR|nr:hypothetical protein E3N88_09192 [Mikania micrantha]
MGGGDQPLILADCSLEETENLLSPVAREEQPDPLDVDIFGILTGDSPLRYIGFDQQGKPRGKMVDLVNPTSMSGARSSCFKVTGCKALIKLRAVKGTTNYVLYEFSENHNHELVSFENMDLTRKGKHLNFDDLHFVHAMSLNRVGATVAHQLQTSLKGGHHNMRGTRNSYKNVSRDIRMFIGERDVQLVLKKLEDRAKNLHNFSFEVYHFEGVLHANFWADDVSKLSYQLFGDSIAFDATYSTNNSNSIFKVTSGSTNTLVQFLMCFDTTIDNQRYNQRVVDFKSKSTTCVFKTRLELEVHAAKIYTQTIFKDVQKDIYKCMINCFITNVDVVDNFKVYTVSHMDNRSDFVNHFKVSVHMLEHSYECSCMGFTRVSYLRRHILCVFRLHQIKNIPDRYISNRWRKGSLPSRVYSISQRLSVDSSEVSVLRNEVADCLNECVDHLAFNVDGLSSFNRKMKELKRELVDNFPGSSSSQKKIKQCVIEHLVGQHDEETIDLLPPHGIRNKGCGTNRRLVGPG